MAEQFWCPIPECKRSESYGGEKRPFPRSDKRNEHVRKIHQAVTVPYSSSTFNAACAFEAADTINPTGFEGCANDSCPTAVTGLHSGPDSTESVYIHGHNEPSGLTNVCGLSSGEVLAGVNGITWFDGFTNVGGLTRINGLSNVNEFAGINETTGMDGITGMDGFIDVGGLSNIDGFAGVDELTGMDRFASIDEVTGVTVSDVYDYNAVVTSYDTLGWLAGDSTFTQ